MLSNASVRYLLTIYQLSDGGMAVRSVDIANALGVSRASVVKCLKRLSGEGFIQKEYYGNVQLTPLGTKESNRLFTEFTLIQAFLRQFLHLSEQQAKKDAAACLCALSQESKEKMMALALRYRSIEEAI